MTKTYVPFIPFIIALIAAPVLQHELWTTAVIVMCIGIFFYLYAVKGEAFLLALGILFGVLVEVGGDAIYKLQYWENGSFLGIPFWLPLYWGFCFVMIRRFGNLVVKSHQ